MGAALDEVGAADGARNSASSFPTTPHIRTLNAGWRGKDKPTNVLSFPAFPVKPGGSCRRCWATSCLPPRRLQARRNWKTSRSSTISRHLVIHGLLHLLGHDHEDEAEAEAMEALERAALARLAIPDPYA